ncbi:HNH endonuclease domain-containing protein [Chamaesiphon minutus]|uniref:HNH endonuclease domain-containing protein n=1 Tax=Chamaesiphon minutus TaxID=1173032 RepID=UPI0002DE6837|nr:HNH endonuclease domain-containing protein [Chamaesiphon minutus]
MLRVEVDDREQMLFIVKDRVRRIDITSSRTALDGYQKGKCFYCFGAISIEPGAENLADVDHFFPHRLHDLIKSIDGVWNLVLACQECNRGVGGKFDRLPSQRFVKRLYNRNEFLISSFLPLQKTLICQTGSSDLHRTKFLDRNYQVARAPLGYGEWEPMLLRGVPSF